MDENKIESNERTNDLFNNCGNTSPVFVIEEYDDNNSFNVINRFTNDDNFSSNKTNSNYSKNLTKPQTPTDSISRFLSEPPLGRKIKHGSIISSVSGKSKPTLKTSVSRDEDSVSIGACSIANITDVIQNFNQQSNQMKDRLFKFLSIMYALFIIVVGIMIALADIKQPVNDTDHIFGIVITLIGMIWIGFVHWDIQRHKKWALKHLKPEKHILKENLSNKSIVSDFDDISMNTVFIFNNYNKPIETMDPIIEKQLSAYRFSDDKHSSNFYLKCGMTIFCMGSIIHQGVNLAQQVHYFMTDEIKCRNSISLIVYLMRCISAFYYLYIAFKYSNIIIKRYETIARFALMHLFASGISFWFSTIIEEAIEGYVKKIKSMRTTSNSTLGEDVVFKEAVSHMIYCSENALSNTEAMDTLPYLYPFSIEFNIILASVWYMIWTHIGTGHNDKPTHQMTEDGQIANYKSTLTINADCHASNLGLFGGLFALLLILTTIVIFFTTINQNEFNYIGVNIFTAQFALITLFGIITIPLAYRKIRRLNLVSDHHLDNSATAMDDLLVLVPLPFYYVHHILCIRAQVEDLTLNSVVLIITYLFNIIQVTIQSPFIVDGIRRCANNNKLRFAKPGKGLVTFALMLNIGFWILFTFEIKSIDKYHKMQKFYGKFIWMIISDTCLPLILFYRFHCSVCLSDIWKHAYERDEHNSHNH